MKECEAPEEARSDKCTGIGETTDHFTPRCIARKVLGWSYKQTNRPENLQFLCKPCHRKKDATTPSKYYQALAQKEGELIEFGEHI